MPITEELRNVKKLEAVDFSHVQAETLAEIIEDAQTSGNESLKEFIRAENDKLRYDLLTKMILVASTTAGLLFAAIKLF
ncbi:MAG: hypothetical protein ACUZ8O_08735 [Candidatus Anammoxibacter sp.]